MNPIDRNEILNMLAEGKITAGQAIDLLDHKAAKEFDELPPIQPIERLKAEESAKIPVGDEVTIEEIKADITNRPDALEGIRITKNDVLPAGSNGQRPRWLKIRVRDLDSGRNKVSVTLPLGLVSFGLGIARRFGAEFDEDYNVGEIWQMMKEGERGVLVDVEDEEDNEHVQIYLD